MTELIPVGPGGYCNIQDVRAFSGIPLSRVSDGQLLSAIQMGDSQISLLTGRVWSPVNIGEQLHDTTGYNTLRLIHYPVISVSKLEVWNGTEWISRLEWDPNTRTGSWRIKQSGAGILEWISNPPGRMRDAVRVSYKYGYESIPGYIKDLSIRMASIFALQMDAGQSNPSGFQSITEGALSISWGSGAHDGRIKLLIQETEKMLTNIGGKLDYAFIKS